MYSPHMEYFDPLEERWSQYSKRTYNESPDDWRKMFDENRRRMITMMENIQDV
jgi:hypothetical protein